MTNTTTTAPKPKKADLIAAIIGHSDYSRSALTKMTLAALEALAAEVAAQPAAAADGTAEGAVEPPAVPAAAEATAAQPAPADKPKRRTKNSTVEVDGYRVVLAAWITVHQIETGDRVALIRREAVESLASAQVAKSMRVQVEYVSPDGDSTVAYIRNGTSVAAMARLVKKAMKA